MYSLVEEVRQIRTSHNFSPIDTCTFSSGTFSPPGRRCLGRPQPYFFDSIFRIYGAWLALAALVALSQIVLLALLSAIVTERATAVVEGFSSRLLYDVYETCWDMILCFLFKKIWVFVTSVFFISFHPRDAKDYG